MVAVVTREEQERQAAVLRESPSRVSAAERLGISVQAAKTLASRLRAAGFDVPLLGAGGRPFARPDGSGAAWGGPPLGPS